MKYSVNNFFSPRECSEFLDFMDKNGERFSYKKDEKISWDCKRVYDTDFKSMILEKINFLYDSQKIIFWFNYKDFKLTNINISLTKYYDGRYLDLHRDSTSSFTTVIPITENYNDGRFVLAEKYDGIKNEKNTFLDLKMGQGVTFEGGKTYHGVMHVTEGTRCAMNIWMNDRNFEYYKIDLNKKLI